MPPRRFYSLVSLAAFTLLLGILFLRNPHNIDAPLPAKPPFEAAPQASSPPKNPIDIEPDPQADEYIPSLPTFLHGSLVGTGIPHVKPAATSIQPPNAQATRVVNGSEPVRVTIVESGGSHEEVVAALVYAFGSQPNVELSLYLLLKRFGLPELMDSFALSSNQKPKIKSPYDFPKLYNDLTIPHILVLATCELDLLRLEQSIDAILAYNNSTHIFCIAHNGDIWSKDQKLELKTSKWIDQERITFVTLSPHTQEYFKSEAITNWELRDDVVVQHLVPVYPVPREGKFDDRVEDDMLAVSMQGNYDNKRRNYASVFSQLEELLSFPGLDRSKVGKISLHVVGHGSAPLAPEIIRDHVFIDSDLEYLDYYPLLSHTVALLPAFATDDYLDRKASSSVPTSLMAGTPLVADKYILDAYSYLPKEIVWFQKENQTEMQVVESVIQMPAERREKKMDQVRRRCSAIIEENITKVGRWLNSALYRTES